MTKFETVGINNLYAAHNLNHLKNNFAYSCNVCCNQGLRLECDRCAISVTQQLLAATMAGKGKQRNEKRNKRQG